MIISRSIHVAADGIISFFLWMSNTLYTQMYIYINIYIYIHTAHLPYPFTCWWIFRLFPCLGYCKECCYVLGYMYLFALEFLSFLDMCRGRGMLEHMVMLFLVFEGTSILFSTVAVPVYILTNSVAGFPFLHTLSSIYYL